MLLGLPVDGKAVNGSVQQPNSLCEELLGRDMVEGGGARGQGIILTELKNYYAIGIERKFLELDKVIKARNDIMILFGNLFISRKYGKWCKFYVSKFT